VKIIFLDIDGVLNSQVWFKKQHELREQTGEKESWPDGYIDPEAVEILNELVPHCKFVISSTWRHSTFNLGELLKKKGFKGEIIGQTPDGCRCCVRGNEIQSWLKENVKLLGVKYYKDFKDYAIIDDDDDFLIWQADNFFNTDYFVGLTPKTTYKIKRFLGITDEVS
jgi:hypothetical protein